MFNFIKLTVAALLIIMCFVVLVAAGFLFEMSAQAILDTGQLDLLSGLCLVTSGGILIGGLKSALEAMGD